MKRIALALLFFFAAIAGATAEYPQSHLELQSAAERAEIYNVALSKVFKRIYADDVILSALLVPSFPQKKHTESSSVGQVTRPSLSCLPRASGRRNRTASLLRRRSEKKVSPKAIVKSRPLFPSALSLRI